MRSRIFLAVATLTLFVTGCTNQRHPSFSAFHKLSPSQLSSFKAQIRELPIKKLELPTKLPFTVSNVSIVPSVFGAAENIPVSISIGGEKIGLRIIAAPVSKKIPLTIQTAGLEYGKVTKLHDGTKALYGNDGDSSMLVWEQDGVGYTLSPSNAHNKPELSEQQLVQVADSFT